MHACPLSDQVGAIYGGFKIGRSAAGLPLRVCVEPIDVSVSPSFCRAFERRVCLVYTGQQRLAKNTLINALRRCAITPLQVHNSTSTSAVAVGVNDSTVGALVAGAEAGAALLAKFFDRVSFSLVGDDTDDGEEDDDGGDNDKEGEVVRNGATAVLPSPTSSPSLDDAGDDVLDNLR